MLKDNNIKPFSILAIGVGVGLTLCGYFIGNNFYKAKFADRYVTVKGSSEKIVEADLALWPVTIKATGDDLTVLNHQMEKNASILKDFLFNAGIEKDEISLEKYNVIDLMAQTYRTSNITNNRFIISSSFLVKTNKINEVKKASQDIANIVNKGVIFGEEYGNGNTPIYEFTNLNDIKLDMLKEANQNAKNAAEQFARDSGSKIGGIRKANQGIISISSQYSGGEAENYQAAQATTGSTFKKVRMVATIEYYLKD